MKCPKCEGKAQCVDTVQTKDNETYRKRVCLECDHVFYTCEYMVFPNEEFMKEWRSAHRWRAYDRRRPKPNKGVFDIKHARWQITTDPDDYSGLDTAKCSSCGHTVTVGREALPNICPGCNSVMYN